MSSSGDQRTRIRNKLFTELGYRTLYFIEVREMTIYVLLETSQFLIEDVFSPLAALFLPKYREYSFAVAPAAKALEGFLYLIALEKGMVTQREVDNGISIGSIFPQKAKKFVLYGTDKGKVDKIYGDYSTYRSSVLHFDKRFLVKGQKEAIEIITEIHKTIRLTYKIFIGDPSPPLKIKQPIAPLTGIIPGLGRLPQK